MTDAAAAPDRFSRLRTRPDDYEARSKALTAKRYAQERRFKALGLGAILVAMALLLILLTSVIRQGHGAFWQTYVQVPVTLDAAVLDPKGTGDPAVIGKGNFQKLIYDGLFGLFPEVKGRSERRQLTGLVSSGANLILRRQVLDDPALVGTTQDVWIVTSDEVDQFMKGNISRDVEEAARPIKDAEINAIDRLEADGRIEQHFNTLLFTQGDSREPELAGIWGAVVGSFYLMLVTVVLATPLGVGAALYLEEFAPRNRTTDLIEVNINNLAAVPSIVFGLLGLAVFLGLFHMPRSAPIVGGLTLTLMTLPTIVVATRAALRSVPPSIHQAALGIGASKVQTIWHHVLPLALPGILTGVIIGLAQALGETAPLLMIGMVAFVVNAPSTPFDPSTALPVQIYLWADSPERAFTERTGAAIMILLLFLILMNLVAVLLRRRFERRW